MILVAHLVAAVLPLPAKANWYSPGQKQVNSPDSRPQPTPLSMSALRNPSFPLSSLIGAIAPALENATAPLQSCRFVAYFRAPTTPSGGSGTAALHSETAASNSRSPTAGALILKRVLVQRNRLLRVRVISVGKPEEKNHFRRRRRS